MKDLLDFVPDMGERLKKFDGEMVVTKVVVMFG